MELLKAVASVAESTDEKDVHVGVVECEREEFCRDAFGMRDLPELVLFHSGVWSVGTTWVWTTHPDSYDGSLDLNIDYVRDFALKNYKLKAIETRPWRLLYNPSDQVSRALWKVALSFPEMSFAQVGELWDLRKNAVVAIFVGGLLFGLFVQKVSSKVCC